jgi:hypothetical protein
MMLRTPLLGSANKIGNAFEISFKQSQSLAHLRGCTNISWTTLRNSEIFSKVEFLIKSLFPTVLSKS